MSKASFFPRYEVVILVSGGNTKNIFLIMTALHFLSDLQHLELQWLSGPLVILTHFYPHRTVNHFKHWNGLVSLV